MSEKTVLLIDDSATIRRLVDSELSSAGYRVLLAPTAEEGLDKAAHEQPNLIILDHQLPGTTGYEVACRLLENPDTASIPVVASSTLRKKAYSEYIDCDNVVDMLPKPYSPEVLIATVENAIETAQIVVQSQSGGTAVPEVMDESGDSDLGGTFQCFSLREVIDLVNNGMKQGVLEITASNFRVYVYTEKGRIQAVTASGIDPDEFVKKIPSSLADLAPVVKFTVGGKKGTEVNGLVELLDNKVLDPRLLRTLLRFQAATLLKMCFTGNAHSFRFEQGRATPPLFAKLPLDLSLLALLVEGALHADTEQLPQLEADEGFVRQAVRGQNLDRAGLSSKHMTLMKVLAEPTSLEQISSKLGWEEDETRRVLWGFELADLVQRKTVQNKSVVYCVSSDAQFRQNIGNAWSQHQDEVLLKTVSDLLALGLLLRRQRPDAILVDVSDAESIEKFEHLKQHRETELSQARLVAVTADSAESPEVDLAQSGFDFAMSRHAEPEQILAQLLDLQTAQQPSPGNALSTSVASPLETEGASNDDVAVASNVMSAEVNEGGN